jgi:phage-related holin
MLEAIKFWFLDTWREFLIGLGLFLSGIQTAMFVILFFVVLDTILGVLAARKLGQELTSRKFGRSLYKFLLYPIILMTGQAAETYLTPGIPWFYVGSAFVTTTEMKSLSENVGVLLGISVWSRIKLLLWKEKGIDIDPTDDQYEENKGK